MPKKSTEKMLSCLRYIKRHKDKPYGYYSLGMLYLYAGDYKRSEKYLSQSVKVDSYFYIGYVGLITNYIFAGKYKKAIEEYSNSIYGIDNYERYRKKLHSDVSKFYDLVLLDEIEKGKTFNFFKKIKLNRMKKQLRDDKDNSLLLLIYSLNRLVEDEHDAETLQYFKSTVKLNALEDNFRWALIYEIFKYEKDILEDRKLIQKFNMIPTVNCPSEYLNKIFAYSLKTKRNNEIVKMFNSSEKLYEKLDNKNLWKYIAICKKENVFDENTYNSSRYLIKNGWIDKNVAEVINLFSKNKDKIEFEMEDIDFCRHKLTLYGY